MASINQEPTPPGTASEAQAVPIPIDALIIVRNQTIEGTEVVAQPEATA